MKILGNIFRLLLLVSLIGAVTGCAEEKEPFIIGAVLPMTGGGGPAGEGIWQGLNEYAAKINARGGVSGQPVELVLADSQTSPEQGVIAFEEVAEKGADLVISAFSSISTAIAPRADALQVPVLALAATSEEVTKGRRYMFKYSPGADMDAQVLQLLLLDAKVRSLAVIYVDDEYGRAVLKSLRSGLEGSQVEVTGRAYSYGTEDYTPMIRESMDADALCFVGFVPQTQQALRQLRDLNYQGRIMAPNIASNPLITSMPEAEGLYLTALAIYKENFRYAEEFKELHPDIYQEPIINYIAFGYDAMKLITGLMDGRDLSRESVRSALDEPFVYSGILGTLQKKQGQHNFAFPLNPAQVRDGRIEFR